MTRPSPSALKRPPAPAGPSLADAVFDRLPQGLLALDADARVVRCNAAFAAIASLEPDTIVGRSATRALVESAARGHPLAASALRAWREHARSKREGAFEASLEGADGRRLALKLEALGDGGFLAVLSEAGGDRDRHESSYDSRDPLTELPDRRCLLERLGAAVARGPAALLCLDLDRFKQVNDTLGHPVGDALLRAVADRLRSTARKDDTVARMGGDEFVVLVEGGDVAASGEAMAARLVDLIGRPYLVDGHMVSVSASVGLAVAPHDGATPEDLLKRADLALYAAKRSGRGAHLRYDGGMDARQEARRALEAELRRAVALRSFELRYQPQHDVASGRIVGFEALLRWRHPERGLVSPAEFVPLAEETGLIVPIGEWVLREACKEAAKWPDGVKVAVNVSVAQFASPRLLPVVRAALKAAGLPPERLEIEITESLLLKNDGEHLDVLREMQSLGVRVAMDDFGTGHSSLSNLQNFPFDKIKIDRSFVAEGDPRAAAVVQAIAALGRGLQIATTAEGWSPTPSSNASWR